MPENEPLVDVVEVEARFQDWYGSRDDNDPSGFGDADWSLRDPGETLSHCIVREDVPNLIREINRLNRIVPSRNPERDAWLAAVQKRTQEGFERLREARDA